MTPELYGLAVFVLPGFAGSGVFFFLRPTHKLSDFERLAVSLFFSCGAYGFMLIALHGLSAIPGDYSYFSFSESGFSAYIQKHKLIAIPAAFMVACLEGLVFANITKSPEFSQALKKIGITYFPQPDIWNQVMEEYRIHRLMIETSSKTYIGRVKYYSVNPNMDPEIHMDSGTLDVQPLPDGNLNFKVLNVLPHGVYLRSAEIRAVTPLTEPARRP